MHCLGQVYSILGRHCLLNSVYLSPALLTPPCNSSSVFKLGTLACLSCQQTFRLLYNYRIGPYNHAPAQTQCLRRVHAQHRRR